MYTNVQTYSGKIICQSMREHPICSISARYSIHLSKKFFTVFTPGNILADTIRHRNLSVCFSSVTVVVSVHLMELFFPRSMKAYL